MSKLSISNVVRVTLLAAQRGLNNINTSALVIITDEAPIPGDFGISRTYLNSEGVKQDFGSNSDTFALAEVVFAQNPNILTGKGFLVVIPREQSALAQPATLSGTVPLNLTTLTASDYHINADVDGGGAADLLIGPIDTDSIATVTTSLNSTAVTSADLVFEVSGDLAAAFITLKTISTGATKSIELGLAGTGTDISVLLNLPDGLVSGADAGLERVKDAVLRTQGSVNYFGVVLNEKQTDSNLTELALTMQGLDKLLFVGSSLEADNIGIFKTLKDLGYTHTRCVFYSISAADALSFVAGYASRGLSVNFDGTNTAQTMELKEVIGFIGFIGDTGLTQSIADVAKQSGVDVYADYGVPGMKTSGENQYFDQVYSRLALKVRLQIAGFNFLKQTNTKIPQTEEGLNGLKGEYRKVLILFVSNGTFAPGIWTGSTTFGNPGDHIRNIADFGYYVFAESISKQSQTERDARVAPLVQVAAKDAGAFHSSDVVVLVEA